MKKILLTWPQIEDTTLFPKCHICGGGEDECPGGESITVMTDPSELVFLDSGVSLPEGYRKVEDKDGVISAVRDGVSLVSALSVMRIRPHLPDHLNKHVRALYVGKYKYVLLIPENQESSSP